MYPARQHTHTQKKKKTKEAYLPQPVVCKLAFNKVDFKSAQHIGDTIHSRVARAQKAEVVRAGINGMRRVLAFLDGHVHVQGVGSARRARLTRGYEMNFKAHSANPCAVERQLACGKRGRTREARKTKSVYKKVGRARRGRDRKTDVVDGHQRELEAE